MVEFPLVTVVVTSYNRFQYLQEAVQSVLNQSYKEYELIVMDDNSSDIRIHDFLQDISKKHENVKWFNSNVREEDRYQEVRYSVLINDAVFNKSIKSDYVTYLADDDYYFSNRLSKMVTVLENNTHYDIVYGRQAIVDVDGNQFDTRFDGRILDNGFDILDHNQVMHTRTSFVKVNGWPTAPNSWGGADSWFWDRLSKAGYKFYPIKTEEPLDAKRYHQDAVQWKIANGVFEGKWT